MKILFIFLVLIAAIPPLIGFYGKSIITEQIKDAENTLDASKKVLHLSLESHQLSYLSSEATIKVVVKTEKNTLEHFIKISISNVPNFAHLIKGTVRFDFKGAIPKLDINTGKDPSQPISVAGLIGDNLIFKNSRFEGGFYYPEGVDAKLIIESIISKNESFKMDNLAFTVNIQKAKWSASVGFNQTKINALFLEVSALNSLMVTEQDRSPNPTNVNEWTVTLNSPSLNLPDGIKLKIKTVMKNLPQQKSDFNLKKAFELKTTSDITFRLVAGDSKLETWGKAHIEKQGEEYVFYIKGDLSFAISEESKKIPMVAGLFKSLEAMAPRLKEEYAVDILTPSVSVPIELRDKDLYINNIRYFDCPMPFKSKPFFSVAEVKTLSIDQIRNEAMEDFLIEDNKTSLAESFCRLKYVTEVMDPKDSISKGLYNLLEFKMNDWPNGYLDPKIIATAKNFEKEDELIIFLNFFHCYINFKSEACIQNKELVPYLITDHPFQKLIKYYYAENINPAEIMAIIPEEGKSGHVKVLYSFFRTKIMNNYFLGRKQIQKLNENLNVSAPLFTKNFLPYERVNVTCKSKDFATCAAEMELLGFEALPRNLKETYLQSMVKFIKGKKPKVTGIACNELINQWGNKLTSLEQKIPGVSQWSWRNDPNVTALAKECTGTL